MKAPTAFSHRSALMLLALASAVAWSPHATAHAVLVRATPAANSAVFESPTQVTLSFSEPIEPAFSTLEIVDEKTQRLNQQKAKLDNVDPRSFQLSLPPLPSGKYRVIWRVLSIDGHVSKGEFTFEVAPKSANR